MIKKNLTENDHAFSKEENYYIRYFKLTVFFIIPVSIGLAVFYYKVGPELKKEIFYNNFIDPIVIKTFENFDKDGNGVLSIFEFQNAFYSMEIFKFKQKNAGKNNFRKYLQETIKPDVEILSLQSSLLPLQLKTLRKFKEDFNQDSFLYFQSLIAWDSPNLKQANFSVHKFSDVFIPKKFEVGYIWELLPIAMGQTVIHLQSYNYLPTEPSSAAEQLFFYILSMLHPQPFLRMRFPPFGAVAAVRAVGENHIDVSFRLHSEFQINNEPDLPFWFTPAAFVGNIIIKKDGSHIVSFNMHVPNYHKLNVDLEWLTKLNDRTVTDKDNEFREHVDIGYIEKMEVFSTCSSTLQNSFNMLCNSTEDIKWFEEIEPMKMFKILEKQFYPFKEMAVLLALTSYYHASGFFLQVASLANCSGRTLRESALESPPVMQLLSERFVSCWSLVADMEELVNLDPLSDISRNAKNALESYKFPVQSIILTPNGSVIHSVNANDILNRRQYGLYRSDPIGNAYLKFLNEGLERSVNSVL